MIQNLHDTREIQKLQLMNSFIGQSVSVLPEYQYRNLTVADIQNIGCTTKKQAAKARVTSYSTWGPCETVKPNVLGWE